MNYSRLLHTAIYETRNNQLTAKLKFGYFWIYIFSLIVVTFISSCGELSPEPQPLTPPSMKGYSYTSFNEHGFEMGVANNALSELSQQTGSDFVALNIFLFQDTCTSTEIYATTTTSTDEDIRIAVADARAHNMKVFLKPNVDPITGAWRGCIQPDADGVWFRNYKAMIVHYAKLAEELHCELFSIGCELIAATTTANTNNWIDLITEVRSVYHGEITYCANWSGNSQLSISQPEFQQVQFWSYLDYIGIDCYYRLTQSTSDNTPSLRAGLKAIAPFVQQVQNMSYTTNKPVIFAECGCPSVLGATTMPWDFQRGLDPNVSADEYTQHMYYAIMIEALNNKPWFMGFFWWNWESVPSPNESKNFTVKNKLAARTLKLYYQQES